MPQRTHFSATESLLRLLSCFLIPLYTLLFCAGYDWFTYNFSVIGNMVGHREGFLIWGILVGLYFGPALRQIKRAARLPRPLGLLPPAALLMLFCAITTPYLPEEVPFQSFLHIVFSAAASVLLLLFLLLVSWRLSRRDKRYRRFFRLSVFVSAVSLFLLLLVGIVSSALEIFLTIGSTLLCEGLRRRLRRQSAPS